MNAEELYLAGRVVMKLGRRLLPAGSARMPLSVRSVLADAAAHPDSAIGAIAARTGLLQSHVSGAVRRLCQAGLLIAYRDPRDGRRTLVRSRLASQPDSGASDQLEAVLVKALTARLGAVGAARVAQITRALEVIVSSFSPERATRPRRHRHGDRR